MLVGLTGGRQADGIYVGGFQNSLHIELLPFFNTAQCYYSIANVFQPAFLSVYMMCFEVRIIRHSFESIPTIT